MSEPGVDQVDPGSFSLRPLAVPAYGPALLFGLGEGAILPVIPLSARDLGASVATAAAVVMLVSVGSLVFNVPASAITYRFGERPALIVAAVVGSLASVGCLVAPGQVAFCLGVLVIGMARSVYLLARQTYLSEAVPPAFRARALSTLGGVMRVGVFAGPFVGAVAIHIFGLRGAYVVCAVALAVAGMLAATMRDLPHRAPEPGAAPVTVRRILVEHRRTFATVGTGVLLVGAVRATRQAVVPLWAEQLGLSPQLSSVIYGISGGIDMLVFYPAGKVMDLRGRRWVTVPSMLVMGGSLIAMPLTHTTVPFTLVCCLLGFGNGIGSGMIMTLGADFSPSVGRPQFLGIWRLLSDTGQVSGPALLSVTAAAAALGPAIAVSGGVGLLAALVMWRSVPSRR